MVLSETPIVDDSTPWTPNPFYLACSENNFEKARQTVEAHFINECDKDGNTPLHIASSNGYDEIVELLFRYHADYRIQNKQGKTAKEVAKDDEIRNIFKVRMPKLNSNDYVSTTVDVEWIDSYKNAYRIAYENREHMKRWLLKVSFKKLADELLKGYIEQMEFDSIAHKENVKMFLSVILEDENPLGLVQIYTGPTGFYARLNKDLAEIGSNFRFLSTQNLFNSGYLDNEAPKGLGQHIFAAIMMNHPSFQIYHLTKTFTTFRGMNITPVELKQYKVGDYVLTRSFLSTSTEKAVADVFRGTQKAGDQALNMEGKLPVLCVYTVKGARSGLRISESSEFEEEQEILIVPFVVFEVTKIDEEKPNDDGSLIPVTIYLEERDSNIP